MKNAGITFKRGFFGCFYLQNTFFKHVHLYACLNSAKDKMHESHPLSHSRLLLLF